MKRSKPLHLYCVEWFVREFGGQVVTHVVATSKQEAWGIVKAQEGVGFDGYRLIRGRIERIETVGDHKIMLRRNIA